VSLARQARLIKPDLKIVTMDIERIPGLAWAFDQKTRFIPARNFTTKPRTICMAWRWYGQRKIEFGAEWETDHETFIRQTWDVFHEADAVISFNGLRFDCRILRGDWARYGLTEPRPWKDIDLYPVVRRFGYLSSSLENVTQELGRPGKQSHYSIEMAVAAVNGDTKAQKRIAKYNKGDVELTEWLEDRVRPWIDNHPFPRMLGDEKQCNRCGSTDLRLDERRYRAVVLEYSLYECRNCHGWVRGGWEARAAKTRGV
jgi:hypothetical protein